MHRCAKLFLCQAFVLGLTVGCARPSHPVPDYSDLEPSAGGAAPAVRYEPQAPASRAVQRPFLWVVRAGAQPSFLFGTIHVGVALEEALGPQRISDLRDSRSVIVEMDPDEVDRQAMAQASRLPSGSLHERFTPGVWHDLVNELHTTHAAQALREARPWYPLVMLTQQRIAALHGGRLPMPMDARIVELAREAARPVLPLETPAEQLEVLNSVPEEDLVRALTRMVEHADESRGELRQMLRSYREGDEDALTRLIFDPTELARTPALFQIMFFQRNDAWMNRIREQLDQGGAFVAVGLGHLLGPEGLVAMLRGAGYDVMRLPR